MREDFSFTSEQDCVCDYERCVLKGDIDPAEDIISYQ